MASNVVRWVFGAALLSCLAARAAGGTELSEKLAAEDLAGAASLVAGSDETSPFRSDTLELRIAATAAADCAVKAAASKDFASVAQCLAQAAEAAAAKRDDDPNAWWAVAEARSAQLAAQGAGGQKIPIERWFEVADAFDRAHALRPGATDARKRCVRRLVEAVATVPSQEALLVARAISTARSGVLGDAPPKGQLSAAPKLTDAETRDRNMRCVEFADALFAGARFLVATDRRSTREVVRAAFDVLRPTWAGDATENKAGTLWNDIVTFERERKFGIGEKYAARREFVLGGNYDAEVPIGGKWQVDSSGAVHSEHDGTTIGTLTWDQFQFDCAYEVPGGVSFLGGDNPSGLADMFHVATAHQYFEETAVRRQPRKTKITGIIFAFTSELTGTRKDKKYGRIRSYFFRGVNMRSYLIRLLDATPAGSELDVETSAFFESFRERKDR